MKISFVTTVLNEEKTIGILLDSLFRQTRMADEIVIVDGSSTDKTLSRISDYCKNHSIVILGNAVTPKSLRAMGDSGQDGYQTVTRQARMTRGRKVKIFIKPNATIAQGRNYGIKKATGDIIAMSDAGCILHNDWLKKITKPFIKNDANIVAGFYRMTAPRPIQKALAVYLGIPPKRFDPKRFLPSARSMAFKKSLWRIIGGFNENLDRAGEDTLFNYHAIKHGAKFARVKDALVDWEVPNTLWDGFKKFYIYAKGDAQVGIWWHPTQRVSTHNIKIFSIFLRYIIGTALFIFSFQYEIVGLVLVMAILLYLAWPIWKMRDVITDFKTRFWLPVVQIGSDIAILSGTTLGILRRL